MTHSSLHVFDMRSQTQHHASKANKTKTKSHEKNSSLEHPRIIHPIARCNMFTKHNGTLHQGPFPRYIQPTTLYTMKGLLGGGVFWMLSFRIFFFSLLSSFCTLDS